MPEITLNVQGMTCSACTASVTEALEQLPLVTEAAVSLLTSEAKVKYSMPLNPQSLVIAVEDCGFDARIVTRPSESFKSSSTASPASDASNTTFNTTLTIVGMTCSACSSSVAEAIERLDGVRSCSISLLTHEAKIAHASLLLAQVLIATVEECGFDASLLSSTESSNILNSTFSVSGMTCGACSASIISRLDTMPGIISADVSQITNEALVTHTSIIEPIQIKEAIEDCGFDVSILLSKATSGNIRSSETSGNMCNSNSTIDDITLQVYGLQEDTDLSVFQYNTEAILNSLPGVLSFHFVFHGSGEDASIYTSSNDGNIESLLDVLRVRLSTDITGVRVLVDALNSMDERYSYTIFNSIDQSLSSQLKILSKANDIKHWRTTFLASLGIGLPIIAINATQCLDFSKNLMIIDGLFLLSVVQLALGTFVLFVLGASFFRRFKFFLLNKGHGANMDVLICISTVITYTFSLISIALSVWSGQNEGPPKVLFDTISMLICFVSFGKWIENRAKGATSFALSRLLSLAPTTCLIVLCQEDFDSKNLEQLSLYPIREVSIDLIQNNDIVVVVPGSKMPVDGVIIHGQTEVDESVVTGESLPVHKEPGSRVIGGSINGPAVIYVRVTGAGKNSQLHQIINVVKDSQVNKAPVQRFADYIAARFVFFILGLSLLTLMFWVICARYYSNILPTIFHKDINGKYYVCFKLAISVIVVACPCALGLAAPTAVMVGTGVGASHGALIKGGDVLEKANDVDVILFDKTGTLTSGEMQIVNYKHFLNNTFTEQAWWNLVGSLETNSEHPTAKAIVKFARSKLGMSFEEDCFNSTLRNLKIAPGMGISADVTSEGSSKQVAIGSVKLVVKDFPKARSLLSKVLENELDNSIGTICHVVIDGHYAGYIELSDSIKPCAREVVQYLQQKAKYQVGIITGDSNKVAQEVGAQLGIPQGNIFAEVLPIDKDKIIQDIRVRFGGPKNVSIAFVGDGINDAPALVRADLGMAVSSGTEIAVDSADVVLLGSEGSKNDLYGIITALGISSATFRKIKWNFFCACIYNLVMLPFAMGCFLPFNLMLSPAAAAGAMACSSISVVLNSLMLKRWTPPLIKTDESFNVEESEITSFSLKDSSVDDFDAVKRRNSPFKLRWVKSRKSLNKLSPFARKSAQEYELLDSN